MIRKKGLTVIFCFLIVILPAISSQSYSNDVSSTPFIVPQALRLNVDFWKNIYTKFDTREIVIHDSRHLNIIYSVLRISDSYGTRSTRRKIKNEKRKYKKLLRSVHYKLKSGKSLTEEEKKIESFFASVDGNNKFLAASQRIRSQLGQKDRFLKGIERSGRYIDQMKQIFREEGLPEDLTVIPYVESSFNYKAYSSAGAVGVWQFMRSTARLFMKVNYVIDERRDPLASTRAAAKLLKRNYKVLNSWPMAITAYNHGLGGMKRAKKKIGNKIEQIVKKYKSRSFGFASRNFYCEFLAALEITRNTSKYFKNIKLHKPVKYDVLPIKRYISVNELSRHLKLDKKIIREMNLSLRKPVFESRKLIPKGFMLKIPELQADRLKKLYASIPIEAQNDSQKPSEWHRVRRGDTLYDIAIRFRTSVATLMNINNIANLHRIYAGQILRLPINGNFSILLAKAEKKLIKNIKAKPSKKNVVAAEVKESFPEKLYDVLSPSPAIAENLKYGLIYVEPDETLGHYSEWSGVSARYLRQLNGIKRRRNSIVIGRKIKIPLNRVSKAKFKEKRAEYHMSRQEDYFSNYKIAAETMTYKMEQGDTVWNISMENDIPIWLLKRYNPGMDFSRLHVGDKLSVPVITAIN